MIEYQSNQASRTLGSIVIANALTLGSAHAGYPAELLADNANKTLVARSYSSGAQMPSYDKYMVLTGSALQQGQDNFVESISIFCAALLAKQEPLGQDFSKIMYENLWDLYE